MQDGLVHDLNTLLALASDGSYRHLLGDVKNSISGLIPDKKGSPCSRQKARMPAPGFSCRINSNFGFVLPFDDPDASSKYS